MVEPVAFWDDPDLVAGEPLAGRVAAALGAAPAMLLAGNGGLTVGADLDQALARAWCLEDRCRVALAAGDRAGRSTPRRSPAAAAGTTPRRPAWPAGCASPPADRPGHPNRAAARAARRPGVDHSSTTRILDAFRYQTRWV